MEPFILSQIIKSVSLRTPRMPVASLLLQISWSPSAPLSSVSMHMT